MRLDKYLKITRLIKRRTIANEACDAGKIAVNGVVAKASYNVKIGDIIEITMGARSTRVLEFLDLPEQFSEKNLRKAIIENLKQFILEFGKDFTFIGEEYRVQVGNTDFFIDLLFYNRALSCLVPIELKIGKFKPEHIGQINFYLEALDRDVKKPNENPSVGVILCASKDDAVVEYALSRSMSPTLVADYRLCLPDKTLLQNKLRELTELALESGESDEGDEE